MSHDVGVMPHGAADPLGPLYTDPPGVEMDASDLANPDESLPEPIR